MRTRHLATLLPLLFVAACSKPDTAPKSTDVASEMVLSMPTTTDEMFVTARSFAAKCTPMELAGPLEVYRGSLDQKPLLDVLAAQTDIKTLLNDDSTGIAPPDFKASPAYAMSCPNGRYVVYQQVKDATNQNWLIGVNIDAKKAAVMSFQNTSFEQAGDVPTLAAIWAYRALGIQDFVSTGLLKPPPADPSTERRQMAVGYLFGVQSDNHDIQRMKAAAADREKATEAVSEIKDTGSDGLIFSGEYVTYPKGSTEAQLRASYPDLNCNRMNGSTDDLCIAKTSLTSTAIVQNLPNGGTCVIDKEFDVTMNGGKAASVSCDIASVTADQIAAELDERSGPPKRQQIIIGSMRVENFEWKVGEDYIVLIHSTGQDVRGNPLDNYHFSVGTQPLKQSE